MGAGRPTVMIQVHRADGVDPVVLSIERPLSASIPAVTDEAGAERHRQRIAADDSIQLSFHLCTRLPKTTLLHVAGQIVGVLGQELGVERMREFLRLSLEAPGKASAAAKKGSV